MTFVIRGQTVVGDAQQAVFGALIQVFEANPCGCKAKPLQSQITNRSGDFTFRLQGQNLIDAVKQQRPVYLQAFDREARALTDPQPVAVTTDQTSPVQLAVAPDMLANAVLPPQPLMAPLIPAAVFDTVAQAIAVSMDPANAGNAQLAAGSFYCTLPPIVHLDDIIDVAQGVLRGRPDDIRTFNSYLDNMGAWNQRHQTSSRHSLTSAQAEYLLSDEFLTEFSHRLGARGEHRHQDQIMPVQRGVTLMVAALRTAVDDPQRLHRNLGTVLGQFCGLRGLGMLHSAALGALPAGSAQRNFFTRTLGLVTGYCGTGGLPIPPPPMGCRNPFWPPNMDDPSAPPVEPGGIEDCTAEILMAFREAMARTVTYTIDSIEPNNACPGQEIVIRGRNFEFEGRAGVVLFPGRPAGTRVPSVPHAYSSTEIRVIVPEGAACGDLELEIPGGAATILACDATLELFRGPSVPFRFNGGVTTIEFFSSTVGDACLVAGDEVTFHWRTCNADQVVLHLATGDGASLYSASIDGGRFVYRIPAFEGDTPVTARLVAQGPCGTDEAWVRFSVRRGVPLRPAEFLNFTSTAFSNWHGNQRRSIVGQATPTTLDELVRAVQTAERLGQRIGVQGSAWSYTDCVVPRRSTHLLIDTAALSGLRTEVLSQALRTDVRTVLEASVEAELGDSLPSFSAIAQRLVHVEAGIKIHALNCLLDGGAPPLALPTMGGDMGQSLAGAINTGTHGANAKLPPIADFVRAIHLVGPGGQQWWLEPARNPVTDRAAMERLKADGTLHPCLKVVYDDTLFDACLVTAGSAGVVYAYVLEAIDAHNLVSTTTGMRWDEARTAMLNQIVSPMGIPEPWFLEVTVNPTREARLTTRAITRAPLPSPSPGAGPDPMHIALLGFLLGPGAVAAVPVIIGFGTGAVAGLVGALPFYIARRTAEMIRYLTNPFEWHRVAEIREEIQLIERLVATLEALIRAIERGGREADFAEVIPNLLNVIWQIGLYVVDGRSIVETAQNIFTNTDQRPEVTQIQKSYVAMTGQTDCAISTAPPTPSPDLLPPAHHSAFERLIESAEYALPAEQSIAFADDVLQLADRVRRTNDAIIVILNIRFTQRSRALLAMQQFATSGHVEIYTVRGLAGNEAFQREVQALAAAHGAIPHWGQLHDASADFAALFGPSLARWQGALDYQAREGRGQLNTFRHAFALSRGLLREL